MDCHEAVVVLDLLHKKQSLISQPFAMFFDTSGSLALLDSTLRKSARDDGFVAIYTQPEILIF